ncbi:MAG TPA: trehalase family glycosidase [Pyrinomonadaceae bacterium]|nr:trehalase family glycosidase [Pyrinomonadaceae bacterium]
MKRSYRATVLFFVCLSLWACAQQQSAPVQQAAQPAQSARSEAQDRSLFYSSASDDLNRLQDFFHPSLKANEKVFEGYNNQVRGFGAGASYPQIWLRDSATIIPASRYYYTREYLTSWIEEHLAHQGADGQLNDWIAAGAAQNFRAGAPLVREVYKGKDAAGKPVVISADKNSTEADQETSAVDAAHQVFQITGDRNWLNKSINGRSLLSRLDSSLEYLLKHRFDASYGLVTNAFTADWGDVSPTYPDQRAIYLDSRTPTVVGLYTNALFYRAARQLAEMHGAVGGAERAGYWRAKADMIRANVNKHLWQEERGFYKLHLLLTPALLSGAPDDSDMFAMGGNAVAALYGVAEDRQVGRIFEVAERRQRQYNISTIGGTLLPPYPKSFFKHPVVNEEYAYQNGGQWDWFAGRFLLAEFERGYSARAYRQLLEVARKCARNNGLYEWNDRSGEARGSANYAGSAGVLSAAVVQGLYGVYLSSAGLDLRIRLMERAGKIYLRQPATDSYLSYHYSYDEPGGRITLNYESNANREGRVCILLPQGVRPAELLLDGANRSYTEETIGEDRYACASTDWKPHRLELRVAR